MNPITLNYSEITQAFMSFMTSRPKWYLDFGDKYYSIDENNALRLHNSNSKYNVLSSTDDTADGSKLKIIINDSYETTKVFDNVSYSADFVASNNLDNITFKTSTQTSFVVDKIERREDTYKFAIPRNSSSNRFSDRMRGKYMISNYEYNDMEGTKFTLPYIKTTYRYSMI